MGFLISIIQAILNAGSTVFMPLIIFVFGLAVGLKVRDAISCGILIGVAFCATGMCTGYLGTAAGPVLDGFAAATGLDLKYIDMGWTVASAITWAWPYVFIIFPIALGINIVMLVLNWTSTMNVDIWNYWGKAYTAALVAHFSGSVVLGYCIAAVQTVLELLTADAMALPVQELTGIPGVTSTHCMFMNTAVLYPIDWVVKKIPGLDRQIDVSTIRDKFGPLGEVHVIGTIVGTVLALVAGNGIAASFSTGVQIAAAMTVLPRVAKIFMEALEPISDAASTLLREKFSGREVWVGLDWPFLAGIPEIWVTALICVPVNIACTLFYPGNQVFPLNNIMMTAIAIGLAVVTKGNLIRMLIGNVIYLPVYYFFANFAAPAITALGNQTGSYSGNIALLGDDTPWFRGMFQLMFGGHMVLGVVLTVIFFACFVWYYGDMKKEAAAIKARRDAE